MKRNLLLAVAASLLTVSFAYAECPEGTWPRDQYSGPGGGAYSGPGGGAYTGPGGGAYTGPGGGLYTGPGGGLYTGPGGGLYTGPGGGLYTGPGGGLYAGPGGGMYPGPGQPHCSNTPPLPVLIEYLESHGMNNQANEIRSRLMGRPAPLGTIVPAPVLGLPSYRAPVTVAPVTVEPVAPRHGIDPSILLAGQPAPIARPSDFLEQMLLLQQLAAARREYTAPAGVAPAPRRQLGSLRLKIQPREGQVYVDGVFVGTVDDFDGLFPKFRVDAGGHRIKITAPGHETISLDVWITPNKMVTYQGKLPRVQ